MRLVDSNILIYAARPEFPQLKELLEQEDIAVSELSRVEVLGFHDISEEEVNYFNAVFELVTLLPVNTAVIERAKELRQTSNIKTADAIIAATTLLYCNELITRNTDDFDHIPGLIINNPLA